MARQQTVISLDPIDRKKRQQGIVGRMLITRWSGGKSIKKMDKFGHYMFCGPQGSGKTSSALWYAEKLAKKYKRKHWSIKFYSNFGVGRPFKKDELFKLIDELDPYEKEVRIFIIDEIHTYYPKEATDKITKQSIRDLNAVFSQLRKRNCYIISTAQIYGRLDKALREQCLYMIDCKVNLRNRLVNQFIAQEDILVDDLGRWAGIPKRIYVHGLSKLEYDTKRLIRE